MLAASVTVASVSILAVAIGATVRLLRQPATLQRPDPDITARSRLDLLETEVAALRREVQALPSLWEHERKVAEEAKKHADKQYRAAESTRAAIQRAREEPESEEEYGDTLELFNGHGGGEGGLHAVSGGMASDPQSDLARRAAAAGVTPFI